MEQQNVVIKIFNCTVKHIRPNSYVQLIGPSVLTHWGRVTHICVSKLTIIGSDNVLSPGRRQAIIWTNAGILLIWTLGTNFSETLSEIHAFSFKKMHLKMSSGKWRPSCLGFNVLKNILYNCFSNDMMVLWWWLLYYWPFSSKIFIIQNLCLNGINSSPPVQHGRHFADDAFKCIFVKEKVCILIQTSLNIVSKGPIDNIPALV